MAGGMNKRGSYGSMADRIARSRGDDELATGQAPPIKHCWVTSGTDRHPGLLLTWRQRPDGWHGRVAHPVPSEDGWILVEEWLPAALLQPADSALLPPGLQQHDEGTDP